MKDGEAISAQSERVARETRKVDLGTVCQYRVVFVNAWIFSKVIAEPY